MNSKIGISYVNGEEKWRVCPVGEKMEEKLRFLNVGTGANEHCEGKPFSRMRMRETVRRTNAHSRAS